MAVLIKDFMSYFRAPVSPYYDGGVYHAASLEPSAKISLERVAEAVAGNAKLKKLTEAVRGAPNARTAKAHLLPYVTPMGVFKRRNARSIISSSGLAVLDFDNAGRDLDLEAAKRRIFDTFPQWVRLAFTSPGGRGLKLFIDLGGDITTMDPAKWGEMFHHLNMYISQEYEGRFVLDESGKDFCRACFLCHDPDVLYRPPRTAWRGEGARTGAGAYRTV